MRSFREKLYEAILDALESWEDDKQKEEELRAYRSIQDPIEEVMQVYFQ